jgi:hypothetical protein
MLNESVTKRKTAVLLDAHIRQRKRSAMRRQALPIKHETRPAHSLQQKLDFSAIIFSGFQPHGNSF